MLSDHGVLESVLNGVAKKSQLRSRFSVDKSNLLAAFFGVSIGLGLGLSFNLYKYLFKTSESEDISQELVKVKMEVIKLRQELHNEKFKIGKPQYSSSPLIMCDSSEDENFYDVESDDYADSISRVASYESALSQASDFKLIPEDIIMELDQLADFAMGECLASSSPASSLLNGETTSPGMKAYGKCFMHKNKYSRNPEYLWRLARATYLAHNEASEINEVSESDSIANHRCDPNSLNDRAYEMQSRSHFIQIGLNAARKAISNVKQVSQSNNDPKKLSQIYKWLAVMIGLASNYCQTKERISMGYEFKELIEKAIELDNSDAVLHYLKGRWCYDVYSLTWIERQIASRLFAEPPTATLEEAEAAIQKAESLRPNHFAAVYLYLAKCRIYQSDYMTAIVQLEKAKHLIELNRFPTPYLDNNSNVINEVYELYSKYSS